jgi:hypothetical protein
MKMRVCFFFLLIGLVTNSCKLNEDLHNSNIFEIVISEYENKYFEDEGFPKMDYILDKTFVDTLRINRVLSGNSITKYFSVEDINSMKIKNRALEIISLETNKTTLKKLIPSDKIHNWDKLRYDGFWNNFENTYGKSGFYAISQPLFSNDGNKFIIMLEPSYYRTITPNFVLYFENVNGKWILKKI